MNWFWWVLVAWLALRVITAIVSSNSSPSNNWWTKPTPRQFITSTLIQAGFIIGILIKEGLM